LRGSTGRRVFYSLIGYEVVPGGLRLYASLATESCPAGVVHEHEHRHGHEHGNREGPGEAEREGGLA